MAKKPKRPKAAAAPTGGKRAAVGQPPQGGKHAALHPASSDRDRRFTWRFGILDYDGGPRRRRWSWLHLDDDQRTVLKMLATMEQRTWDEAAGTGNVGTCKRIPAEDLCRDAQHRLVDLELDDQVGLWEIRVTSRARLWGVRLDAVFYVLWWDPNHEVCPGTRR